MKILILGANGMFGSAVYHVLGQYSAYNCIGTVRNDAKADLVPSTPHGQIISNLDVLNETALLEVMKEVQPDLVVNCTGLIKQRPEASDPQKIFPINALFPHRLADLCQLSNARMIQFSTDCIFSGEEGNYADDAPANVSEFYGLSKYIGEVGNVPHVLTLRTSIIGHEKDSTFQLVDWFLAQKGSVKGYTKAIFSGFPTIVIAQILRDYVIPNPELHGTYNMSADPIAKYDLLKIIRSVYGKDIDIIADDKVKIDRSLNSSHFRNVTGYNPPSWQSLIETMHQN